MSVISDKATFKHALDTLQPDDYVETASFSAVAGNSKELIAAVVKIAEAGAFFSSLAENVDTREGPFLEICRALYQLDQNDRKEKQQAGIQRAKAEGKYLGRKPISLDTALFDSVVEQWRSGEITAKAAMEKLNLKPNTFYRRINERKEEAMKDYKKVEKEIKEGMKEAARQSQKELDELKKQVRAEAKELKQNAEETLSLHEVQREIVKEKFHAESEYNSEVRQLKKDVEAEAKELKKLFTDQ